MEYYVLYNSDARKDLTASFEWGVENWGAEAAAKWYNEIEEIIDRRLSTMPRSCPLARENDDFSFEVRNLIYGRYRVLFTITGDTVRILHLRGPYTGAE